MSSPKVIVQILITGTQIFGKALFEAGRQAVKNAKYRPQGGGAGDAQGVGNATTGSVTDKLTREHLLTLDEAHLILNLKKGDTAETMLRNYEHLFKANSPPPKTTEQAPQKFTSSRTLSQPISSHYLLSKVVRARERIEAEAKLAAEELAKPSSPPPPPNPTSSSPNGPPSG